MVDAEFKEVPPSKGTPETETKGLPPAISASPEIVPSRRNENCQPYVEPQN